MKKLDGYKTYLIVAVMILGVFAEKIVGIDIPGFDVADDQWLAIILGALGIGTLRSGVSKVETKVEQQTDLVEYTLFK